MWNRGDNQGAGLKGRGHLHKLGFSLLEVLISLLIITTVLASISRVYQLLMKRYHLGLSEQYLLHRLAQLADSITLAIDSHPLPDLIRTHADGKVRFIDGLEISLNQPMAANSNAITLGRINLKEALLNNKLVGSTGSGMMIEGCGLGLLLSEMVNFKRFLLFDADGYSEALGSFHKVSTNCVVGNLHPNRGLISTLFYLASNTNSAPKIMSPIFIAPISELLTFYLDESGTVRLLNHEGERIIENQPLFNGAKELKFKVHNLKAGLLPALEIWVKTDQEREFTIFREAKLVRASPVNPYLQLAGIFKQRMMLQK